MSITEQEAAYEEYISKLYEEHREEAIREFTADRLSSYYYDHKLVAEPAYNAYLEAGKIMDTSYSAGLIFSAIAVEVGLKVTLLKPIVFGLVHAESTASLITDLAISPRTGMEKYRELLLQILREHGGIDLDSYKRSGSTKSIWEEINVVQHQRNVILHRAEKVTQKDSKLAYDVASTILNIIFPEVIKKMGMHLHDGFRICAGGSTCPDFKPFTWD